MIRPTTLVRVARAFTALVTVWCLGCSGYDPLIDALLGAAGRSTMTCASDANMTQATDAAASVDHTITNADDSRAGFDCGCGSCTAAAPIHWDITRFAPRLLTLHSLPPAELASVVRTPLSPPPEFVG